jgi:sporulation protein YlmC with PRC-barrel domain
MKQVLLTGAALLMGVSMACAETSSTHSSTSTMAPAASMNTPGHPAAPAGTMKSSSSTPSAGSAQMGADMFATIPAGEELSSNVIGLEVYNSANQDIGKIKDIAFDQNGVKAYIVAVGGFLGMGDHYVAVNPSAVNINYDSSAKKWHAAMNTDADQLKAAPEYKYSSNQ